MGVGALQDRTHPTEAVTHASVCFIVLPRTATGRSTLLPRDNNENLEYVMVSPKSQKETDVWVRILVF